MGAPNAHAPVPSLLRSLSRAGWAGVLREDRACRALLRALSDTVVRDDTGIGKATLWQIGQAAGYRSKSWISRKLAKLEDAGIITWSRGGIVAGKQVPSVFCIVKTALVALINAGRRDKGARELEHREREAERIHTYGYTWKKKKRKQQKPRSVHATQSENLLSPNGGVNTTPPVVEPSSGRFVASDPRNQALIDAAAASAQITARRNLAERRAGSAPMVTAGGDCTAEDHAEWLRARLEAIKPGMGKEMDRARARRSRPWSAKGKK